MCTAVLRWDHDGVLAVMNRDERRDRAEESPPRMENLGTTLVVAPRDSERGGTWIGGNEHGLVAFVLNGYVAGDLDLMGRPDVPSRGTIVSEILKYDGNAARHHLRRHFDPSAFPSFTLVVADPDGALVSRWRLDGTWDHEELPTGWNLITSSAWRTDEVCAWRAEQFSAWRRDGAPMEGTIPAFNLFEAPDLAEWSPMMSRSWSATRSITRVEIVPRDLRLSMSYWQRTDNGIDVQAPDTDIHLALRTPVETVGAGCSTSSMR